MTWDVLVETVTKQHPGVAPGRMFGMPCLKGSDGTVIACLTRDGGLNVKLSDDQARAEALKLPGARTAAHAFDLRRPMKQWVHLPASEATAWLGVVECGLAKR